MATFIRRNIISKQFTFEQLQLVKYFKRTDTKTYLVTDTTCLLQRLAFHPKEPTLHLMTSCRLLHSFQKKKMAKKRIVKNHTRSVVFHVWSTSSSVCWVTLGLCDKAFQTKLNFIIYNYCLHLCWSDDGEVLKRLSKVIMMGEISDWLKIFGPYFNQWEAKPKPPCTRDFSALWASYWKLLGILIGSKRCFVPVAIGRCNYLIVTFWTASWKPLHFYFTLSWSFLGCKHEKRHQIDDKRSFQITETRSVTETIFKSACYWVDLFEAHVLLLADYKSGCTTEFQSTF